MWIPYLFTVVFFIYFLGVGWDWVHLVRRPLIGLLYQLRMIDDEECGAFGGKRIGRGNGITRRKLAPVPLCPPQIPHDLTWARTRAAAVGIQWLTAWVVALPVFPRYLLKYEKRVFKNIFAFQTELHFNRQKVTNNMTLFHLLCWIYHHPWCSYVRYKSYLQTSAHCTKAEPLFHGSRNIDLFSSQENI
jgi:hypothetical protein